MKTTRGLLFAVLAVGMFTLPSCGDDGGGGADTDTDSDTDTDMDTDSDSGSDSDTDTDSDTDMDTDVDTDMDAGADAGAELDAGTDAGADAGLLTDCTGLDDFTLCSVVTVPDRSYDICIDETCQSPGCGTVACNPPGPHFTLADTNQRLCYDADSTMTCPVSGAYSGQDAQYGWDAIPGNDPEDRFTRSAGSPSTEYLVQDNVTGLMWQGCQAGLSDASCATGTAAAYIWADALAYCDGLSWGGFLDWRLPDQYELESIVDLGTSNPSIDASEFPATMSDYFWSSSTSAHLGSDAWNMHFEYGYTSIYIKSGTVFARCVRGEPTPRSARFVRDISTPSYPVVTDNTTGLEWQGCEAGLTGDSCTGGSGVTYNWTGALAYCEGSTWAGHDDWRLPNMKELASIVDDHVGSPAVDVTAFPAATVYSVWSSSSSTYGSGMAWIINSNYGVWLNGSKTNMHYVRCVRGGPWD